MRSAALCARLARHEAVYPHAVIAVYLASPAEIDLTDFIRAMLHRSITVVAPRWNGATYELAVLRALDDAALRRGPMGIREPREAELVSPHDVTAWFVPALAFDRRGNRLGYGGGWYDRLLADAAPDALRIGVGYDFQMVEALPHESHDVPLTDTLLG